MNLKHKSKPGRYNVLRQTIETIPEKVYYSFSILVLFLFLSVFYNIPKSVLKDQIVNRSISMRSPYGGSQIRQSQQLALVKSKKYTQYNQYYHDQSRDYLSDLTLLEYYDLMGSKAPTQIPLHIYGSKAYFRVNWLITKTL